ncbi:MAG: large repetitive protein, partial [Thermoleophilaceae bacterium]|nr:large repetitive protein [Thermoleophilaceae bacterium]
MRLIAGHGRAAALAVGALLAMAAPASAFTVNTAGDPADATPADGACDASCTLRSAINASNTTAADDTIGFASGMTIVLSADLPQVTDAVTIDGYSAPGSAANTGAGFSAFNAIVNVNVEGSGHRIFDVTANDVTIRGVRIYDSSRDGVLVEGGAARAHIEGNYIGEDAAGTDTKSNIGAGVAVFDASAAVIGGTTAAQRNLISGNGESGNFNPNFVPYGVYVRGNATDTLVQGNLIGTDATGKVADPNGGAGVRVGGYTNGDNPVPTAAKDTVVGGFVSGAGNVISGNGVAPLNAEGVFVGAEAGSGIAIAGNRIGTDVTGTAPVPNNYDGVELLTDARVHVGADDTGSGGNLISGNTVAGLRISSPNHVVVGNKIGTDVTGTVALPNGQQGIYDNGNSSNLIGGT